MAIANTYTKHNGYIIAIKIYVIKSLFTIEYNFSFYSYRFA